MRPWRLVLLGLLAAAAAATVVFWPWIDAERRAVIVLSGTSPTPVLSWAVRVATSEPKAEETVLGGTQATIVRPGNGSTWPAVVLMPGTAEGGRQNPSVQRLAHALARAGFLVAVPDLPGIADGEIVRTTVQAAVDVALDVAHRPDVKDSQVALAGAWAGATVALLAAEDEVLAPRVSVVAAVAPWAAVPDALRLATTGFVYENPPTAYEADPFLSLVAARTLVAALAPGPDRDQLRQLLSAVPRNDPTPLRVIQGLALVNLSPAGAAVVRLLANTRASSFDGLYASLPASVRVQIDALSPAVHAPQIQAPVELAVARNDRFAPPGEAQLLQRQAPGHVHVTITGAVRSGLPEPSIGSAFAANGFVVRALHAAQ